MYAKEVRTTKRIELICQDEEWIIEQDEMFEVADESAPELYKKLVGMVRAYGGTIVE